MAPTPDTDAAAAAGRGASFRERLAQTLAALADVQLELERERHSRLEVQALFELVLGAMSDAVILADARGRVWRVNQAASRLVAQDPEEMVGRTVSALFGEGVPATPWEVLDRAATGKLRAFDASVPGPDGLRPVSLSASVLQDPSSKVVGVVYAARDLSETQHLLHELEEAEARWRLLAEVGDLLGREVDPIAALPDACQRLAASVSGGVAMLLTSGPSLDTVVTWPADDDLATHLKALAPRPVERRSALWAAIHERRTVHAATLPPDFPLLSTAGCPPGVGSAALVPLVARDAALGAVLVHAAEAGAVTERVVSLVEVAAARIALALANWQLREALAHLEAAREAAQFREDLLAGVSHDMQTPLAVLIGSIEALQAGDVGAPDWRSRLYDAMGRQGNALRRLIQQFLDYSRLEAGRPIVLRPCPADVRTAVARIEADVGGRRPLRVDVPDDLPPAYVDPDRLEQVLTNLVSNAVKFSEDGTPVSISARSIPDSVSITVADRGRGMSPADLANVFEKFHRGAGAGGTSGTGLGLYITRAVVEAHGGRLTATSRLGEGSRFTVVLPRDPPR